MDISRKSCRLCLSETDFNVSLFGNYCRRTNMIEKILVCHNLVIEDSDYLDTICYKCAVNIERYHEFVVNVRKCQVLYCKENCRESRQRGVECSPNQTRVHVTSYMREQVYDADYTFSFLEMPTNEEKLEPKVSSPFFSYFSPPSVVVKPPTSEPQWKTPKPQCKNSPKQENRYRRQHKTERALRRLSRDMFESQSQENDMTEPKSNWIGNSLQVTTS